MVGQGWGRGGVTVVWARGTASTAKRNSNSNIIINSIVISISKNRKTLIRESINIRPQILGEGWYSFYSTIGSSKILIRE